MDPRAHDGKGPTPHHPLVVVWIIGFVGSAATIVAIVAFGLLRFGLAAVLLAAAPIGLASLMRPRLVTTGAAVCGSSATWAGFVLAAQLRCMALNTLPDSRCTWGDNGLQMLLIMAVFTMGLLMSLVGSRPRRTA